MSAPLELRLLGVVLDHPLAGELASALIAGRNFSDERLGAIFDRIVAARSRGVAVDADLLPQRMVEWGLPIPDQAPHPRRWSEHDDPAVGSTLANELRTEHLRRIGSRIFREGAAAVGTIGVDPYERMAAGAADLLKALDSDLKTDPSVFEDLGDILARDMPYDWLVPGLLERQDRLVLTGTEGGGKSYLLRQIAIAAAAGIHPFTLEKHRPCEVMVVDVENTDRQWKRSASVTATVAGEQGTRDPRGHVKVQCRGRLDLTNPSDEALVHRWVDELKPDILMIGPLYKMVPRAITNDDDAAPLITALDGLRDRGLTLLMEAHAGHSQGPGGARDMRPRGSSALLGWPEFGLGVRGDANNPDLYDLVPWRGHRDARAWPTKLRWGRNLPWEAVETPRA